MNIRFLNRSYDVRILGLALALAAFYLAVGANLGLSDDEAYYWVLAQRPGLGFAYHPPMVAWWVALSEFLFRQAGALPREWIVRLPAVVGAFFTVWMGMDWVARNRAASARLAVFPLLMPAFLIGAWMIVPDSPFFAFAMLLFRATWSLVHCKGKHAPYSTLALFAIGIAGTLLSKFNAVAFVGASALSIWLWAEARQRKRIAAAFGIGCVLGVLPPLIWNHMHEWVALEYQFQSRHQGGISFARWLRYVAVQLLLYGPLFFYGFTKFKGWKRNRALQFALIWALPSLAVFSLQPLFGDFKLHWSLAGWLWIALALGLAEWKRSERGWLWAQKAYTALLAGFFFIALFYPVVPKVYAWFSDKPFDPRWDVTNDFYGWRELSASMREWRAPILGLRYQTASQAAFAFGQKVPVTLYPLGVRDRDEWPHVIVTEGERLIRPVFVVGDARYSQEPRFDHGDCRRIETFDAKRFSMPSRAILVWFCAPSP